jgi:hypothetical protein
LAGLPLIRSCDASSLSAVRRFAGFDPREGMRCRGAQRFHAICDDIDKNGSVEIVISVPDEIADAANARPVDFGRQRRRGCGVELVQPDRGLADNKQLSLDRAPHQWIAKNRLLYAARPISPCSYQIDCSDDVREVSRSASEGIRPVIFDGEQKLGSPDGVYDHVHIRSECVFEHGLDAAQIEKAETGSFGGRDENIDVAPHTLFAACHRTEKGRTRNAARRERGTQAPENLQCPGAIHAANRRWRCISTKSSNCAADGRLKHRMGPLIRTCIMQLLGIRIPDAPHVPMRRWYEEMAFLSGLVLRRIGPSDLDRPGEDCLWSSARGQIKEEDHRLANVQPALSRRSDFAGPPARERTTGSMRCVRLKTSADRSATPIS